MFDLVVPDDLAREIHQQAKIKGVAAEAVLEAAWRHYRTLANRKKIDEETTWWSSQTEEIKCQFQGEYVAIHHHAVVDHDPDRVALHKRIREKHGKIAVLIIPAEGPRDIRILSPRLEN
jgi:hypothetical protein